jgi:ribonuclease-3
LSTKAADLTQLETGLGHAFTDRDLLKRALTHASMGGLRSNERLEFLGDRVLGLIVAERLYTELTAASEGELTVRLHSVARREACARAAEAAGLPGHLILAAGQIKDGRQNVSILADAFEAVVAALYLDGGYDAARRFVLRYWDRAFVANGEGMRDAKTVLQEWAQSGEREQRGAPVYTVTSAEGPAHAPRFKVEVRIPPQEHEIGEGSSKREAEQDAARRLLVRLGVWKG